MSCVGEIALLDTAGVLVHGDRVIIDHIVDASKSLAVQASSRQEVTIRITVVTVVSSRLCARRLANLIGCRATIFKPLGFPFVAETVGVDIAESVDTCVVLFTEEIDDFQRFRCHVDDGGKFCIRGGRHGFQNVRDTFI